MEYIFFVDCNIVEIISKKIIKKEGIKNYHIISHPRYEPKKESISVKNIYNLKSVRYNLAKNWKEVFRGDSILEEMTNGAFYLFLPYANRADIRLLMTNQDCQGFSFMEEGLTSYCSKDTIASKFKSYTVGLKERLSFLNRVRRLDFYEKGYDKVYSIHGDAFPNYDRKEVLDVNLISGNEEYVIPDESCILVCDSLNRDVERSSVYLASLVEVLNILDAQYRSVLYKLHPNSYRCWQETVIENLIARHTSSSEEIDRSVSIENMAAATSADVIVNLSSTGFYCALFTDCEVYSFYNIFASNAATVGTEEDMRKDTAVSDCIPDAFWENVNMIKR